MSSWSQANIASGGPDCAAADRVIVRSGSGTRRATERISPIRFRVKFVTQSVLGDPEPGRSALDQRRAQAPAASGAADPLDKEAFKYIAEYIAGAAADPPECGDRQPPATEHSRAGEAGEADDEEVVADRLRELIARLRRWRAAPLPSRYDGVALGGPRPRAEQDRDASSRPGFG
ncbi:MAG: hypothetical protein JO288_20235 [Hyphomicrobiales bacterium]|nr:hypothetical protein [Hyphomicrobiales bacterium]